ncbi:hypothetical protein ACHAWF_000430, partial [Thalassiosira exigua]
MHGQRQGIKSTKKRPPDQGQREQKHEQKARESDIFLQVYDLQETIYTDQTDQFPYLSSKGNRYIMVGVHIDANYIAMEPMKNRPEGQMIEAYERIVTKFKEAGLSMKKHILDNEASEEFKATIKGHGMTHKLVPPGNHRRSIAERAIQIATNHFTAQKAFPCISGVAFWHKAKKQLNMLQQPNVTPKNSAYSLVHGPHNFKRHPWAPLGNKMLMHEPASKRKSWDKRAVLTWHLGSSTEHYRCFIGYVKKTRAERVSDTVFIKHAHLIQPILTKEDTVVAAAAQLNNTLRGTVPKDSQHFESLQNFAN